MENFTKRDNFMDCWFRDLGFMVFRVYGLEIRVQGLGFRVDRLGFSLPAHVEFRTLNLNPRPRALDPRP